MRERHLDGSQIPLTFTAWTSNRIIAKGAVRNTGTQTRTWIGPAKMIWQFLS